MSPINRVNCIFFLMIYFQYFNNDCVDGAVAIEKMFARKVELKIKEISFTENSAIKPYVTMRKFNRTHTAFNYNCTITKVVDDKFRYDLEVVKWGDGGWKHNVIKYASKDPCASMKYTLGPNFEEVMGRSGHPRNCPLIPGFYGFTDYCIEATHIPLIIKSGKFRVVNNIYDQHEWMLKFIFDVDIIDVY